MICRRGGPAAAHSHWISRWRSGAGPGIPAGTEGRDALEPLLTLPSWQGWLFPPLSAGVHAVNRSNGPYVLALGDSGSTLMIYVFHHLSRLMAGTAKSTKAALGYLLPCLTHLPVIKGPLSTSELLWNATFLRYLFKSISSQNNRRG